MRPRFKRVMLPVLGLAIIANLVVAYLTPELRPLLTVAYWDRVSEFGRVLRLVHANHIDAEAADLERLTDAAMIGMLASLDEHSRYIPVKAMAALDLLSEQEVVGVGVDVQLRDGRPTIVRTMTGGPGCDAGLKPGDVIVSIDGTDTSTMAPREVVERLHGTAGSQVSVAVARGGGVRVQLQMQRSAMPAATVRDLAIDPSGVAYLRIAHFARYTGAEFSLAMEELVRHGMTSLVLDLRHNPGGLLPAAVDVAGALLHEGQLVVSLQPREGRPLIEFAAQPGRHFMQYPVVVLINRESASAAEIVAGALQDTGRALLLGERTFGKGSVQDVYLLPRGSAVQTTTARYLTPAGRAVDIGGITPDIVLEVPPAVSAQLMIQQQHAEALDARAFEELFGFAPEVDDVQLGAAVHLLRELPRGAPVDRQAERDPTRNALVTTAVLQR